MPKAAPAPVSRSSMPRPFQRFEQYTSHSIAKLSFSVNMPTEKAETQPLGQKALAFCKTNCGNFLLFREKSFVRRKYQSLLRINIQEIKRL
jgi:hypothetical protein